MGQIHTTVRSSGFIEFSAELGLPIGIMETDLTVKRHPVIHMGRISRTRQDHVLAHTVDRVQTAGGLSIPVGISGDHIILKNLLPVHIEEYLLIGQIDLNIAVADVGIVLGIDRSFMKQLRCPFKSVFLIQGIIHHGDFIFLIDLPAHIIIGHMRDLPVMGAEIPYPSEGIMIGGKIRHEPFYPVAGNRAVESFGIQIQHGVDLLCGYGDLRLGKNIGHLQTRIGFDLISVIP